MFWSEEATRRMNAVNAQREEQRLQRSNFTMTTEEAKKDPAQLDITACAEYDRAADARKAAWEASPFAVSFDNLTSKPRLTSQIASNE